MASTAHMVFGQENCPVSAIPVSTSPSVFTAEDEVTITADLSACPGLAGQAEIWVWIFVPDCCGPTFGNDASGGTTDFCNSNPNLAMTPVEGQNDVWTFTFTPTQLFGRSAAEIDEIGFIPKVNGCPGPAGQTANLILPVEPLVFTPTENRAFPSRFGLDDFVTLYFDQSLATNPAMAELEEIFVHTWVVRTDSDGNPLDNLPRVEWELVGTTEELKMIDEGNGVFSLTFIPETFYPINEGDIITEIRYLFRNAEGTVQTDGDGFVAFPVVFD